MSTDGKDNKPMAARPMAERPNKVASGIAVPADRSLKQVVTGFCSNPKCKEDGQEFWFPVEHDHFSCPKCGANQAPMVGVIVSIHLLLPEAKGPIAGTGGLRYRVACDSKREHLATFTNLEAATGDPAAVTCPDCLAEARKLGLVRPLSGFALQVERALN